MDIIPTGESNQTNPAAITPDSGTPPEQPTPKTPDEAFAAIMDAASSRMAGLPPKQPEPAPAPQDKPAEAAPDKRAEPEPQTPPQAEKKPGETSAPPEGPRMVTLRVDGQEITVPEDRLVALAQQGVDYTKKTQALAEQRRQLEAWQAVIGRIQSDPQLAERFKGLFVEQPAQAPTQPQPQETPPEDPVERLKWEITREAVAKAQEAILGQVKPITEQQAAMQHAMRLQAVKADVMRDPAYPEVMQMLRSYVDSQPDPETQQDLFNRLNNNYVTFLNYYARARNDLVTMKQRQAAQAQTPHATPQAPQQPAAEPTPAPQIERKVTPREAPKLESAGQGVAQPTESAARAQTFKEIQKKIRSGRSTDKDLGELLVASGAIGRMTKR